MATNGFHLGSDCCLQPRPEAPSVTFLRWVRQWLHSSEFEALWAADAVQRGLAGLPDEPYWCSICEGQCIHEV